jgi:hypothetical protein
MTDHIDRLHTHQNEGSSQETSGEHLTVPMETQMAVQQLREAGFSEDQQAALTTALLRVLALWTQQATRGDLHAEHQALAQRLAQQLEARHEDTRREIGHHADALREDMRREVGQHADMLRAELRDAFAQHAALLPTTHLEPPRWRDVLLWLSTALLALTTVGVTWLVIHRVVGP